MLLKNQLAIAMRFLIGLSLAIFSTLGFGYGNFGPVKEPKKRINPNEAFLTSKIEEEKKAIVNYFTGNPGCYILCIGPPGGLFEITKINWLHGLIRISGSYKVDSPTIEVSERFCYPNNLEGSFSDFTYYRDLCNQTFRTCNNYCLGNGDTGSFFTNTPIREYKPN